MCYTRIYRTWRSMKDRCENPNNKRYKDYGGRGILICETWSNSFVAFWEWASSHGYADDLTIERIDVNGGYNPSNCTFIPNSEQSKNRRMNVCVAIGGETKTITEWAKSNNLTFSCVYLRYQKGVTGEELIAPAKRPYYSALAKSTGIGAGTLRSRVRYGWDKESLHTPLRSRKHFVTINGVTKTVGEWAQQIGVTSSAFIHRLKRNLTDEQLLSPRQDGIKFR